MNDTRLAASGPDIFQAAVVQSAYLWNQIFYSVLMATVWIFLAALCDSFNASAVWLGYFTSNAAAMLMYSSGCYSAYNVAVWRRELVGGKAIAPGRFPSAVLSFLTSPWRHKPPTELTGDSDDKHNAPSKSINPSPTRMATLAMLSASGLIVWLGMSRVGSAPSIASSGYLIGGIGSAIAYYFLVSERTYAAAAVIGNWPEANALRQFARVPIVVMVVSSPAIFLNVGGILYASYILVFLACFEMLVIGELSVRAILAFFTPQSTDRPPSFIGNGFVIDMLRWPPRPLESLRMQALDGLGIELQQAWAFSFIRRAAPVVATAFVLFAWVFSGWAEVPLSERAIYERFGRPVAVLHPGLHIGLPWPLGRIVRLENGTIREIATSKLIDPLLSVGNAEGPAPDSANRLWDGTHISEKSQIIASRSGDRESFQLVNMDVRIIYRIGLSDDAAMRAAYRVTDVDTLVENVANRILVHDFASRSLDEVLSGTRLQLSELILAKLQSEMDHLDSGIEILAVVIEAIHPPAGAADAYHSVQAGQITSQALLSIERGAASSEINQAQEDATTEISNSVAAARDSVAKAQVTQSRFDADRSAYAVGGQAFLSEEYFRQLALGLSHSKTLIIDHDIGGAISPTLDLRDGGSGPADAVVNEQSPTSDAIRPSYNSNTTNKPVRSELTDEPLTPDEREDKDP